MHLDKPGPNTAVLDDEEQRRQDAEERRLRRLRRLFPFLLVVVFLVYGFTTNLIPSSSMQPTLNPGDQILTMRSWLAYFGGRVPSRGDIVIFNLPPQQVQMLGREDEGTMEGGRKVFGVFRDPPGETLIKRVVGLPGETILIKDGRVHANGQPILEPYQTKPAEEGTDTDFPFAGSEPTKLGPDEVFVMGDNRLVSEDSRFFGPIKMSRIRGKYVGRLFHREIKDPLGEQLKEAEERLRNMRPLRRSRRAVEP